MKICSVCREEKPLSDYHRSKNTKDGHTYRCKPCDREARYKYRTKDPKRYAEKLRNRQLKYKYGIDLKIYREMLEEQKGGCRICGASSNNALYGINKTDNFSVDHCHDTGKVRGLLCNQCNRALGFFKDDPELLRKAANYLEQ